MSDPIPAIDIKKITEEILNSVNSEIEKKIKAALREQTDRSEAINERVNKLAELGEQQQKQMATLIDSMNDVGKKVEGLKRISKTEVEKTGKGFTTLLDDDE
jgi:methyl-accepting chemotaxis protein